jgi:hypothetical protein
MPAARPGRVLARRAEAGPRGEGAQGFAAGVLFSPVFALFLGWFIGWPRIRRLWPGRKLHPAPDRRAGAAPG